MKKLIILSLFSVLFLLPFNSVDARKSSFKIKSYAPKIIAPKSYKNGGRLYLQKGYVRKTTGKYVMPHLKTKPDNTIYNNRKYLLGF